MSNQTGSRPASHAVTNLNDALPHLVAPFPADAINFKIQSQAEVGESKFAQVVAYLDARNVAGRLDHVVGRNWSARYEPLDSALRQEFDNKDEPQPPTGVYLVCHLTVCG